MNTKHTGSVPPSRAVFHNRTAWLLSAVLALAVAYGLLESSLSARGALTRRPELLVSVADLAQRLDGLRASGQLVVDVREAKDYQAGHIPGAVNLPAGRLWVKKGDLPGMLPPDHELQALLREAGIDADTVVVAYDDNPGLWAARLFWALDYAGQGKGRLLDGGWKAWTAQGLPVSRDLPQVTPSALVISPRADRLADVDWVRSRLGDADTQVLDARSPQEYEGKDVRSKRGGHVPGAINVNWAQHLNNNGTGQLRPIDELSDLFEANGIRGDKEVVTYCQTNVRGSHSYFVMRLLGFDKVRGFDGSWAEWGNLPDTPVVTGSKPGGEPSADTLPNPKPATGSMRGPLLLEQSTAQVQSLLGEPQATESANPCWGNQTVWRYAAGTAGYTKPLRLVFRDGQLAEIALAN